VNPDSHGLDNVRHLLEIADRAAAVGTEVLARLRLRADEGEELKGLGDYVSSADRRSEAAIRGFLHEATPGINVFAEEGGGERGDRYWAVDPLDGTTNFLIGLPVVAVSVALIETGRPVVGAVRAPFLDLAFTAGRGLGARSGTERLSVSGRPSSRAIVAMAFPFRNRALLPRYRPVLETVVDGVEDVRRAGAAALDLAWVAAGVFDGYLELNLSVWDLAAGSLLVEEAGGVVTDWDGGPRYLERGEILAGSPQTHAVLLAAAKDPG
jgi:myo-inositol-1(or 4)-monophosphatase